jgi:hypothetical protein
MNRTDPPTGGVLPAVVGCLDAIGSLWGSSRRSPPMSDRSGVRGPLITLRATESERALIRNEADRRGMSQAELIRAALEASGVPLSKVRHART